MTQEWLQPLRRAEHAYVFVCNDRFIIGAEVLFASLARHAGLETPVDWLVLSGGGICPLSDANRVRLREAAPALSFIDVPDGERYRVTVGNIDHRPALLKMEMLRLTGYRSIIYLDCDMLCTGSLSELFAIRNSVGMVVSRNISGGRYNTGMIAIDGAMLGAQAHALAVAEITDTTSYWLDQPILNRVFGQLGWRISDIPDIYNYQWIAGHPDIPDERDLDARIAEIRLLHWCGRASKRRKPWEIKASDLTSWRLWRAAEADLGRGGSRAPVASVG